MDNTTTWDEWPVASLIRALNGFSAYEKSILWALASRTMGNDKIAWPTVEQMLSDTGMSENTFYKHRTSLVEEGYVLVEKRSGFSTVYSLDRDALQARLEAQSFDGVCD